MDEYIQFTLTKDNEKYIKKAIMDKSYITYSISNMKIGWVKLSKKARNKKDDYISSVILCSFDEYDKAMYVFLVCNRNKLKKDGSILIELVEEYARENGYKSIRLNSISDKVNYYKEKGFEILQMLPKPKDDNTKDTYFMRKILR